MKGRVDERRSYPYLARVSSGCTREGYFNTKKVLMKHEREDLTADE